MHDITIRQMPFEYPDEIDPMVIPGRPEESYGLVALSLLLPYLEPYLIRTMKEPRRSCVDRSRGTGRSSKAFNGPERRSTTSSTPEVQRPGPFRQLSPESASATRARSRTQLEADYRRFSETKSLTDFNLAYAEGFEALTTATAHAQFERGMRPEMTQPIRDLFEWHLIEELEHRTVAFDVYAHVCGGWAYRTIFGLYAQWHMGRWIARAASLMLKQDPRVESECGGEAGRKARAREDRQMFRESLWPKVRRLHLPWYTPHDIAMTPEMEALSAKYSALATRTSRASVG